ncbi:hypothetical protein BBO_04151 [Beauveria brongniartii RCEF 3172]|uniref:Uncharacterized protein n=1 Tax=Beauveria brongniartii RCEF 3172 TaxID=1081107 RepID=A0A162JI53_9HYPO|nr:hypothetical protein BBO_04151 [Beauveria brongniartii RCEF 3172]
MQSLAIYALLASAASLVTAGPVQVRKAAGGRTNPNQLDELTPGSPNNAGGAAPAPGLLPVDGSDTTVSLIITPTFMGPGATQAPNPPVEDPSSGTELPIPPMQPPLPGGSDPVQPSLPGGSDTTITTIITPTFIDPGATPPPGPPIEDPSSSTELPIPPVQPPLPGGSDPVQPSLPGGSDTTITTIITPTFIDPGATPPPAPCQADPIQCRPSLPGGSNTTITTIITPTFIDPGATQPPGPPPGPPVEDPSSSAELPVPPVQPPLPGGSDTTITLIITPSFQGPGATQASMQPVPEPPIPPLQPTMPSAIETPGRENTSVQGKPPVPMISSPSMPFVAPPPTDGGIRISFITITSLAEGPASTVTVTEKGPAATHMVTITTTVTVAPGVDPGTDGTEVAPSSSPTVIEATPNKDGNGVGVSVISIFSPGIPTPTAKPIPIPTSPPLPPADEIGKPAGESNEAAESSTVASTSTSSPTDATPETSTPETSTPDASAPLESAVQGQPSVLNPTSTTAVPPAAAVPPPLPIDLSGVKLSTLLDLGNLMIPATAAAEATKVQA